MIYVFCGERGSGKTKNIIRTANKKAEVSKGNIVFIDDDNRTAWLLKNKIRFISTNDFLLKDFDAFYGFLCGILSEDYDIETMFIDGLFNIVDDSLQNAAHLFYKVEKLSEKFDVDFYITVNHEEEKIPEFLKRYIA